MRSAEIPVWQTVIYMLSKIDFHKKTSSVVGFRLCKLNYYLAMEVPTAVLCCTVFTQVQTMDPLNLCRIPFQGLPLRGNLHSVDITRRIESLICSRLTLNVIHSGQLEAWTFFVRETSLTKSFNQTTPKKKRLKKVLHGKHSRQQDAVEHSGNSDMFNSLRFWNVLERSEKKTIHKKKKKTSRNLECWSQFILISLRFESCEDQKRWDLTGHAWNHLLILWKQTSGVVCSRNNTR